MERGRYVSGLALLFPERAHKENRGCHNEVQEDQRAPVADFLVWFQGSLTIRVLP